MSDQAPSDENGASIPPKLNVRNAIAGQSEEPQTQATSQSAGIPKDSRLGTTMPIDVDRIIAAEGGAAALPEDARTIVRPPPSTVSPASPRSTVVVKKAKKDTARIPLEAALGADQERAQPKTIRIRRPDERAQSAAPAAAPPASPVAPPPTIETEVTIKKKTTRVPLEAAMAPEPGMATADSAQPKTIRIRRPSESLTGKQAPLASVEAPEPVASAEPAVRKPMSETAKISIPEEGLEPEGASETQRKTIKVKRSGGPVTARISREAAPASRAEPGAVEVLRAPEAAPAGRPVGGVLAWVAAAAMIAIGVMAYVMVVQAFPYWELNWPGRILPPDYYNYMKVK